MITCAEIPSNASEEDDYFGFSKEGAVSEEQVIADSINLQLMECLLKRQRKIRTAC